MVEWPLKWQTCLVMPRRGSNETRMTRAIGLSAVVLALLVLLWPVFSRAVAIWTSDPFMDFGFALPPVAIAGVWWRRGALRRCQRSGAAAGLIVVVLALIGLLASERLWARSPAAVSAGFLVWGVVIFGWGWVAARIVAFPIGLVTAGLALQSTLLSGLGFALQGVTAAGAAVVAHGLGLPVVGEGLLLRGPTYAFVVTDACSGMSSLLALLLTAVVWIYVASGGYIARGAVVAAVLPLVVLSNTTRVSLVLLVADRLGQDAALGFFHGASSLVLFGVALVGLLQVSRMVGCRVPRAA
jgi:exosortase